MNFFNTLLSISIQTFGNIENEVVIDWLGKIIKSIIEGCGSIGLGIIVFSVILRLIALPFDIISRVSTNKNNIKMEKIRPELEKLQRQYANNKELYNLKLQKMYKDNGYSPFSACLPTLFSLVLFIVVIGQFSTYSNYANNQVFCEMAKSYSTAVENYDNVNNTSYLIKQDDKLYFNTKYYFDNNLQDMHSYVTTTGEGVDVKFEISNLNSDNVKRLYDYINQLQLTTIYPLDEGGLIFSENGEYKFNSQMIAEGYTENQKANEIIDVVVNKFAVNFIDENIKNCGRISAAETYHSKDLRFLWVTNIWSQDLPWEHPLKQNYADYNFTKSSGCAATCGATCGGKDNKITDNNAMYQEITANLQQEKQSPNGYLILVILSIGIMFVTQIVTQKTQKAQMQLSTVDGENGTAAQSQKMMTWMMPIMFGFFSFMYTASFSIYIIISSVMGTASTLIINKLVEKKFEKIAKQEADELELKRTGRISQITKKDSKNKK